MKYITYIFAFLLVLSSVSAICYNQDDNPFCSKDDPTCTQDGDADTDGDGWSDSCDAFSDNQYLWVDYDGDNIGYGSFVYDCNDLDESIIEYCGNTELLIEDEEVEEEELVDEETNSTQTNSTTTSTTQEESTSSRIGRSHKGTTIYVSDPNDNFQEQENLAGNQEEEEVSDVFPETEIIPLVNPIVVGEDNDATNQITGAVTGAGDRYQVWPLFLLLLAAIIMFIVARKKREE